MIKIDQSKIDAPGFPRGQEWWNRFLPEWVTGAVSSDGTVTIEPNVEPHQGEGKRESRRRAAEVRRRGEMALMRWLMELPQLEPAIVEDACARCRCWRTPDAMLHDGHCCFAASPLRICHSMPEDMRQPGQEIPQ